MFATVLFRDIPEGLDQMPPGAALDTGTTRRRPGARQRRAVEARDRTCVFPGCRMPATACDVDHRIPWSEGGRTVTADLAPGCRHDHNIRHRFG